MSPSALNPPTHSIAIIGAGIAGVCLSIALAKKNPSLHITVYEKSPGITELGVGVGIGPNATRALGLIDADLRRAYDGIVTHNGEPGRPNLDFDVYVGDGAMRGAYLGEMLARDDVPHGGVSRLALMEVMYGMVPESVEFVFGKKVEDLRVVFPDASSSDSDQDVDGDEQGETVIISFTDGTQATADAVIACDGIRSRCRDLVLGDETTSTSSISGIKKGSSSSSSRFAPTFSGRYCYRSVLPMDEAVRAIGPLARVRRLVTGHGRHILMFPVQKGRGLNIAAFVDTRGEEWPGGDNWLLPASRGDILKDFEGFDEGSISLLKLIQNTSKWGLFDLPALPTFISRPSSRICLAGDAAHASSPHCGAGAGMAIEDAYILSTLFAQQSPPPHSPSHTAYNTKHHHKHRQPPKIDIPAALRAYDAVRRPRGQELVARSRRQGGVFCLQFTDEEGLLEDFRENMRWVWDVDYEDMVGSADEAYALFSSGGDDGGERSRAVLESVL